MNYWIPGWPMGFSGAAGESADSYGSFPSFDFRDVGNGSSYARYNFSNGFFVGSQRNTMGLSSISQSAFGGFGSIYSEGVQFGYSLKNGGGPALFVVSDTSKLRAYVNAPQNYVPSIKIGTKAEITVPEYPGRTFTATVEASAQAVDIASGTTRMQLVVDNPKRELMTGAFANVRLQLPAPETAVNIPASALIFNQNGLRVATVGMDDKVLFKTVTIARDLGRDIELASGISADDRIITTPPDGLADGDQVRVVGGSPKGGKPATASEKQDVVVAAIESNSRAFFDRVRRLTLEGMMCDPHYGGNTGFRGWDMIRYPGPRLAASTDDQKIKDALKPVRMSAYGGSHGH